MFLHHEDNRDLPFLILCLSPLGLIICLLRYRNVASEVANNGALLLLLKEIVQDEEDAGGNLNKVYSLFTFTIITFFV